MQIYGLCFRANYFGYLWLFIHIADITMCLRLKYYFIPAYLYSDTIKHNWKGYILTKI